MSRGRSQYKNERQEDMTKSDIIYVDPESQGVRTERVSSVEREYISIASLTEFLKSNLIELVQDDVSKQNNHTINGIIAWLNQQTQGDK